MTSNYFRNISEIRRDSQLPREHQVKNYDSGRDSYPAGPTDQGSSLNRSLSQHMSFDSEISMIHRKYSILGEIKNSSEREAGRKKKNRDNSRRMREKQRKEKELMERKYEENETRIRELECVANELCSELRRMNTSPSIISETRKVISKKTLHRENQSSQKERPSWFGAAF